ncbi:hypothetical protein [Microbacterium sp. P01]
MQMDEHDKAGTSDAAADGSTVASSSEPDENLPDTTDEKDTPVENPSG